MNLKLEIANDRESITAAIHRLRVLEAEKRAELAEVEEAIEDLKARWRAARAEGR